MIVFHDNRFVDEKDVRISINSPGFQYGMGFFTSLKYIDGNAQFLDLHRERIFNSCKIFNIGFGELNLEYVIDGLIKMNNISEARIKIIIYVGENQQGKYLIIPQILSIDKYENNIQAIQVNRGDSQFYHHKSLNYFENMFYKNKCTNSNYDDYLFFNENGFILETIFSNIFFLKGNELFTPNKNLPVLNGIAKEIILQSTKINTFENEVNIENISNYDSCFLTNSVQGIIPVKSIVYDKKRIVFNCKNLDKLPTEILNI